MDAWRLPHSWPQQRERHATFVGEQVAGTEDVRVGIPLLQTVAGDGLWWAEEAGGMAGCPLGQARMKLTDYQLCRMGCPCTHCGTSFHLPRFCVESLITSPRDRESAIIHSARGAVLMCFRSAVLPCDACGAAYLFDFILAAQNRSVRGGAVQRVDRAS